MLKKTQRLSTNRISWLLKKGFKFNNEWFSVKFQLNKGPENRYSIVVSKKVRPLATDRNLLRRQISEIIAKFPITPTTADYAVMIKTKYADLTFTEKATQLQKTLHEINTKLN